VKKTIAALIIILLSSTIVSAQDFSKKKEKPITISAPRDSLIEGETLEYSMEWLGIPIGIIILKVEGRENIDGHPCYHLSARASPNNFFKKFYDMEYNIHSYLDCKQMTTRRFEKVRRIKDALVYVEADFYPEKKQAKYTYYSPGGPLESIEFPSLKKKVITDLVETVVSPVNAQDLLSSLYYFRLLKTGLNQEHPVMVAYERKNWPLKIKVEKLFWKDIYKKGHFALMQVSPDSDLNDQVLGKRKIYVVFTTDSRRIPVEFKLHSNAGYIRGIIRNLPK
jgi:hypothetical protein